MSNGDSTGSEKLREAVWGLRDGLDKLDSLKDDAVSCLEKTTNPTEKTRKSWIAVLEESIMATAAAWTLLRGFSEGRSRDLMSSVTALRMADTELKQIASEMSTLNETEATELAERLVAQFNECSKSLTDMLLRLDAQGNEMQPVELVERIEKDERIDDDALALLCSVCGRRAAILLVRRPAPRHKNLLYYGGHLEAVIIDVKHKDKIFELLENQQFSDAHKLFSDLSIHEEGIDVYCPECDSFFCSLHHNLQEEWDQGFYDCTYATCPLGHKRIIQD